jgi:hypothetical protein
VVKGDWRTFEDTINILEPRPRSASVLLKGQSADGRQTRCSIDDSCGDVVLRQAVVEGEMFLRKY